MAYLFNLCHLKLIILILHFERDAKWRKDSQWWMHVCILLRRQEKQRMKEITHNCESASFDFYATDKICRCVFFIYFFCVFLLFCCCCSNEWCSLSRNSLWGPLCTQVIIFWCVFCRVILFALSIYICRCTFDMKSSDSKH